MAALRGGLTARPFLDEPLLDQMAASLAAKDYRVRAAVETILRSRPFREIRGREAAAED